MTNKPEYIIYGVETKGVGKNAKSFWTNIGAAWNHDDGKGLSVSLNYIPINGIEIVMRKPEEKVEEEEQSTPTS